MREYSNARPMHVLHRVLLRRADGTDKIKISFIHRKTQYQTILSPEVWYMIWDKVTKQTARNEGVKEMRKSIAILLSVLLVLSCFALSACGKDEAAPASETAAASTAPASASPTDTASAAPTATATAAVPAASTEIKSYGYDGQEEWEAAIYRYLVEEIGQKQFETGEGIYTVPVVQIIIYRYLVEEIGQKQFETGEGIYTVPVVQIIDLTEAENGGSNVWGCFEVYNYKIEGETLSCVSGGSFPGKMHVAKTANGSVVDDFAVVEDGANYDSSAKEIFGDRYESFVQESSDENARNAARKQILANYVKANGLKVTQYQDYGWDPVKLF